MDVDYKELGYHKCATWAPLRKRIRVHQNAVGDEKTSSILLGWEINYQELTRSI